MEILVQALAKNYRYESSRGLITTEDLFGLNLEELNVIAVRLHNRVKETEISFIEKESIVILDIKSRLEIVKIVIKYAQERQEEVLKRRLNNQRKKQLAELLAEKQKQKELNLTEEEILSQLQSLGEDIESQL